jgi:hypothetical protein
VTTPAAALMLVSEVECGGCGRPVDLYARIDGTPACPRCWRRAGSPYPRRATMDEVHQAEVRTRERMNARGGADRHMVRAGKS